MKRILITGANSYIGTYFENYMKQFGSDYQIDTLDMMSENWESTDFSQYHTILHVAGIAHRKETKENASLYYSVNCDLVFNVAKKAKDAGVEQFVMLSTMSVYGINEGVITKDTQPNPKSNYGKSKYQGEQKILPLGDSDFLVAILRPPMVYGEGCKGNYQTLYKIVKKSPVFPDIKNRRSMISIENLSDFLKNTIDLKQEGILFPQDKEYVQTSKMAVDIAKKMGKKITLSKLAGCLVVMLKPFSKKIQKAFGSLIYQMD